MIKMSTSKAVLNVKSDNVLENYSEVQLKTASAPAVQAIAPAKTPEQTVLKTQISAPSYFFSLKGNDAPPFRKPDRETKPKLLIGAVMNEADVILMIATHDTDKANGMKKYLGDFLVDKKIIVNFNIAEKNFIISLLTDTIEYAAQRNFSAFKLSVLLTIYMSSHVYFKWYYWLPPASVWMYFKELMIRHTIEDSPDGQEVFEPEECYDIVSHFHTVYMTNLPLVHILTFGAYKLKLMWPFKLLVK